MGCTRFREDEQRQDDGGDDECGERSGTRPAVLGGAMASWFSWRAGFFINVPIGLAMLILAPRFLPRTPALPGRFDITGAITSTLGVGALVFAILNAAENGWVSPAT